MEIFTTQRELKQYLKPYLGNVTIGFVPTMGALHKGHLSLIQNSNEHCELTICSIFVNPTQFNNSSDFKNYPVDHSADITLLESIDCDILFLPENAEEVYKNEKIEVIDIGNLAKVLEGEHRPGHFEGVLRVVKLLFEIVEPTKAFFGLKDYQQYLVIQKMVELLHLNIDVVGCEIIREKNGLAMSSRNKRLSKIELEDALILRKALVYCKNNFGKLSLKDLEAECFEMLKTTSTPEYFKICDAKSLEKFKENSTPEKLRAFRATSIGEVRLIDNMEIL